MFCFTPPQFSYNKTAPVNSLSPQKPTAILSPVLSPVLSPRLIGAEAETMNDPVGVTSTTFVQMKV